jgi:hypothetical protein
VLTLPLLSVLLKHDPTTLRLPKIQAKHNQQSAPPAAAVSTSLNVAAFFSAGCQAAQLACLQLKA